MTATDAARQLALLAAHGAAEKLAQNIVIIDVSDRLAITDCFVIASGANDRQVQAIVDSVEEHLRLGGFKPTRREGGRDGRWVLLDYLDVVVHVQHSEERVFYALERLWKDCPTFAYAEGPDGPNLTVADLAKQATPVATPSAALAEVAAAAAGVQTGFEGGSAGLSVRGADDFGAADFSDADGAGDDELGEYFDSGADDDEDLIVPGGVPGVEVDDEDDADDVPLGHG